MAGTVEDILQELGSIRSYVDEKADASIALTKEEVTKLGEALTKLQSDMAAIKRERIAKMSEDGRIMVSEGRLTGLDAIELAMLGEILSSQKNDKWNTPEKFWLTPMGENIIKARKNLRDQVTPDVLFAWEERANKTRRIAHGYDGYNPGAIKFQRETATWRSQMMDMVSKALDSTTAGKGDELVSTLEAAQLWMDVNLDTVVLPVLGQVPMPSNPYQYPLQLGNVNWYPTSENIQSLTTDPATQLTTMTAYGLKAGVPFSDELEEDAIIALVPELRASIARNAAEVIDDVLLNGDTTATNGINSDGATIAKDTAGKGHWLLGFDGLIHQAIVDNSANMSRNINGAVTADVFNRVIATMGKYAAPRRRGEVVYISDVNTAIRALSIPEFETVDVAGARATLSSGEIMNVYGKPYLHSAQMALADTDGKVTDAGNATSTGRILAFNSTQWRVGFRRTITMESEREAGKGQTTLYTSFRIALAERSATRSTATHTAIAYNITGVNGSS